MVNEGTQVKLGVHFNKQVLLFPYSSFNRTERNWLLRALLA